MLLCQAGRQFWALDTEATEEVEEDWISRWFQGKDGSSSSSNSGSSSSSSSSSKKKKKSKKKKNKAG